MNEGYNICLKANLNKLKQDYHQNLVPMVKEKFESIKNKLVSI
jgi:hypothetical protein